MMVVGLPCHRCGSQEKYLANGSCVPCARKWQREYHARKNHDARSAALLEATPHRSV